MASSWGFNSCILRMDCVDLRDSGQNSALTATVKAIVERCKETDNGSPRAALAIVMFMAASKGTPADLADKLTDLLDTDEAKDLARNEWIPQATGKDGRIVYVGNELPKQYENAESTDAACAYIDERLTPFYPKLVREVTRDDILRLLELKMKRILKFNKQENEASKDIKQRNQIQLI